jgi:hypothetical protein
MHGHGLSDAAPRAITEWLMSFARIIHVVWITEPSLWRKLAWIPKVCKRMVCSILVNRDTRVLWHPSAEDCLSTSWNDAWNADWNRWVQPESLLQTCMRQLALREIGKRDVLYPSVASTDVGGQAIPLLAVGE